VEIDVKDTGIGIPEKDLPHIFEKFYRTDQPAARQERGTGLGLAIVKGIIDAHGGEIRIKSTPGSGTTFTIRLPQNGPRTKSPQDPTHSHAGQAPLLL
jgi:signal transduction histidine kinase